MTGLDRLGSADAVGVADDLGPAVVAVVEVLAGRGRFAQIQLVRDDETRFCPPAGDQVAQGAVVALDGGLARADLLGRSSGP